MLDSKFSSTLLRLINSVIICGAIISIQKYTLAQVTPDSTLGTESSLITPNFNGLSSDRIDGGAIRGSNLFHSFKEFNIGEGREVYFFNPNGIQNILSRVTGNNPSNILGKLGVLGNANLFFINPNGIIFGSNAQLDLSGSFIGSTANSINFADGNQFSTNTTQIIPLLTINIPIGLQYNTSSGRILVQGNGQGTRVASELIDTTNGLRVQPNKTLALVGGSVAIEGGTLKTAGGRIELGSVTSPGIVNLNHTEKGFFLNYKDSSSFGDIKLSQQATVDASGAGGGDIQIRGRYLLLDNGSQIEASTLREERGGTLSINTSELVELIGTSRDNEFVSSLVMQVYPEATGSGGNLTIETGQLLVKDGAQISTSTSGGGNAGSLAIKAFDLVEVVGIAEDGITPSGLLTSVSSEATGTGGNLTIETARLSVRNGGQIFAGTYGMGNAGTLAVKAYDSIELSGTSSSKLFGSSIATTVGRGAEGAGGSLTLDTRQLLVQDGAVISSATFGSKAGGSLLIRAKDSVELIGTSGDRSTSSRLSARTRGIADAGDLTIETEQLTVRNRAEITVSSEGRGRVDSLGTAGKLKVKAGSIYLDHSSITATTGSGDGGDIELQAHNSLLMRRNSQISTTAGTAQAGGDGGDINIKTGILAALESSSITANAFQGKGGNIKINAQGLFLSPDSKITATSEAGLQFNGNIQINSSYTEFAKAAEVTPSQTESPEVASVCQSKSGTVSSLVNAGTGGIPNSPSDPLSSISGWHDNSVSSEGNQNLQKISISDESKKYVEAQGWKWNPDGTLSTTLEPEPGEVVPYGSLQTPPCRQAIRSNKNSN